MTSLEDDDFLSRAGEIRRGDEAVVSPADYDGVVPLRHKARPRPRHVASVSSNRARRAARS